MKLSEIRNDAQKTIKKVFYKVIASDDKEIWKKAIRASANHVMICEFKNDQRNVFIWQQVQKQLLNLYGRKFIKK